MGGHSPRSVSLFPSFVPSAVACPLRGCTGRRGEEAGRGRGRGGGKGGVGRRTPGIQYDSFRAKPPVNEIARVP